MSRLESERTGRIIALAGRRIDPPLAEMPRFPEAEAGSVARKIHRVLMERSAAVLVCAAACGADIIALEVAGELGLRRRVLLPSPPSTFREGSVTDRPGDWGGRFDRLMADIAAAGDLVVSSQPLVSEPDYFRGNIDILDEAARLAAEGGLPVEAVVVWNGVARGGDDVTAHFRAEALRRTLPVTEVLTIAADD